MSGGEIAAIITAVLGGFAIIGGLLWQMVNVRTATMKADSAHLADVVALSDRMNTNIIQGLSAQVSNLSQTVTNLQRENQGLHERDNTLSGENLQQRMELESVRQENRDLRGKVEEQQLKIDEQARQITELQNENADLRVKNHLLETVAEDLNEMLEEYKAGKKKGTGGLDPDKAIDLST